MLCAMILKYLKKMFKYIKFILARFKKLLIKIKILTPPLYIAPKVTGKYVGVWISGGLGNQLFQYSAAYALSKRIGASLLLDKKYGDDFRQEELSKIGIDDMEWSVPSPTSEFENKKNVFRVITEKDFSFDYSVFNLNESCYLFGYWASHLYFQDVEKELRSRLKFNLVKTREIELIIYELQNNCSVSIHIRRGDYNTKAGIESFGLLDKEYYYRAVNLILRIFPDCRFYIFSDDLEEAKNIFNEQFVQVE